MLILNPTELARSSIVAAQKAKTWSGHERWAAIGGSDIGRCARQVVYDKCGQPMDPGFNQDWGAAERGHAVERWFIEHIQAQLERQRAAGDHDVELIWATDEGQKTLTRGPQSVTPDGLFISPRGLMVVEDPDTKQRVTVTAVYNEVKSKDPRVFEKMYEPEHGHVMQVIQGIDLVRTQTQYKPEYGVITYINASFVTQQKTYWVKFTQRAGDGLKQRASWLLYECDLTKLPEPESRMYGAKDCDYCPWVQTCNGHEIGNLPTDEVPLPTQTEIEVEQLATQYREHDLLVEKHTTEKKNTAQRLASILSRAGTKKAKGDWGSVLIWSQRPPPKLNFDQMRADGIPVDDYLIPSDPSVRVSVRLKG